MPQDGQYYRNMLQVLTGIKELLVVDGTRLFSNTTNKNYTKQPPSPMSSQRLAAPILGAP